MLPMALCALEATEIFFISLIYLDFESCWEAYDEAINVGAHARCPKAVYSCTCI